MSETGDQRALEEAIADFVADLDDPARGPRLPLLTESIGPGDVIGDEFELLEALGSGASGAVFSARQKSMPERVVALKFLRDVAASPGGKERFAREVRVAAGLDHPAIVPVVAADLEATPPWLAMKLVEGVSLGEMITQLRRAEVPEPLEAVGAVLGVAVDELVEDDYARWVARVGLALAEALAHAHECSVLHRDVKPWNVLIDRTGRPVLVDLGLARREDDVALTRTGAFVGTLAYSAPEQIRGEDVDERADIYGLGATLFELVNLARPHDEWSRDALLRAIDGERRPRFRRSVPADLETIILVALAARRTDRYRNARAMADDFGAFLAGAPIRARRPGVLRRTVVWSRRHRAGLAVCAVIAVLLAVWVTTRWRGTLDLRRRGDTELERSRTRHREWTLEAEGIRTAIRESGGSQDGGVARGRLAATARAADLAVERAAVLYRQAATRAPFFLASRTERSLAELGAHRVRVALDRFDDVLRPSILERLTAELVELDAAARFGELSDVRGEFTIASVPDHATIEIRDRDGVVVAAGTTPFGPARLPEGSYVAVLDAPGLAPARYPFLVRRVAATATEPGAEHVVRLVRPEDHPEARASWVHVPGGWTLVVDEPPTWRWIDDFFIKADETSMDEWAAYMAEGAGAAVPRFGPGQPLIRPAAGGWDFVADPEIRAADRGRVPVRGLSREEMHEYVDSRRGGEPRGWRLGLPTRYEWIRAARGADGRRYPWGDEFTWDRALGYHSLRSVRRDRWPRPMGPTSTDVSPFGVLRMCGSVAEMCTEDSEPDRARVVVMGGSYATATPEEMSILATRMEGNGVHVDVGLRPVMRRLPAWARPGESLTLPFFDDFDRPDHGNPGEPWCEIDEMPPNPMRGLAPFDRVTIEGGALRLRAGVGDGSCSAVTALPLRIGTGRATVTLDMTLGAHEPVDRLRGRSFNIALYSGPFSAAERVITAQIHPGRDEEVSLSGVVRGVAAAPFRLFEQRFLLELDVAPDGVTLRVWRPGGERPERPLLAAAPEPSLSALDLLVLTAGNLVGLDARIHRVVIR